MTIKYFIENYLTWIISLVTIYTALMTGRMKRNTHLVILLNQILWLVWIVASQTWGLLPLNLVLSIIAIGNHRKWARSISPSSSGSKWLFWR